MSSDDRPRSRLSLALLIGAALVSALLTGLLLSRATLGRTGSWSFPIDDAYIYANYALTASAGLPFEYNPGETSGGVTGLGWFVLLWGVYPLTAPFAGLVSAWAPEAVRSSDPLLAELAGRLYLSAYLLGTLLFALAAVATAWLAHLVYRPSAQASRDAAANSRFLPFPLTVAGIAASGAGLILLADRQAIWGSFSGLELPLSLALVPLALATLLYDSSKDRLRCSLPVAAALAWARPELVVFAAVGALWLLLLPGRSWTRRLRLAIGYGATALAGLGSMMLVFLLATGRPLPSSFYAKVGGLRPERALDAFKEWQAAEQWEPFALLAAAGIGAVLLLLAAGRRSSQSLGLAPVLLVALSGLGFLGAMMLALPWFGQQDRYILPLHPLTLVLAVGIAPALAARLRLRLNSRPLAAAGLLLLVGFLLVNFLDLRVWAARDYALLVQNIEDGHVAPARWIAVNTPADALVAAEPIGAVRLFAGRPTFDIVGLTTPAALGTYGDWPATERLLRERGARFMLFYPAWWPDGRPLPWARELQRFTIPDNRIAGSGEIAVYELFGR